MKKALAALLLGAIVILTPSAAYASTGVVSASAGIVNPPTVTVPDAPEGVAAASAQLANTGTDSVILIGIGFALLIAGVAVLASRPTKLVESSEPSYKMFQ